MSATLPSEEVASLLADLFHPDGFSSGSTITADEPVFLNLPWDLEGHQKLTLRTGENVFWMNGIPKDVQVDRQSVSVVLEPNLTQAQFYRLMNHKISLIIANMKILRVLGTENASKSVRNVVEYFNKVENSFVREEDIKFTDNNDNGNSMNLRARAKKLIASRRKTFSNLLATIANDDNISKLNSAQKADYLRQVDYSQNSRGLARRAAKEGLDFDEIARNEVFAIAKHFHEIEGINDANHAISFYSQDTTLGGIKTLVELSQHEYFQTFNAHEIIELLNLVGVACFGCIGDYPDPSVWRVKNIYVGCNVSLSDILVAYNQSNGECLRVPAIDEEINNVIPLFDDIRISKFLKKYAPSLLEYTFSIGMRRIIAEVPMTIGYTMFAGVWKMFEELNASKSSLHLDVFKKLVSTFDGFVGKYFDHVKPLLREQPCPKKMFYLANNGLANVMIHFIRMYKVNDEAGLKHVPAILRSLYSYEVWCSVRRLYKSTNDADKIADHTLFQLLDVDMSKKVSSKAPFVEEEPEIHFPDEPNFDYNYLNVAFNPKNHSVVNYLALIPAYLKAISGRDSCDSIKDVPTLSDNYIAEALELECDYKDFVLLNVFQALRYKTRAAREDTDNEVMKIPDLKDPSECMNDIRAYIRKQFESEYLRQLAQKRKVENEIMGDRIVEKILSAETYDEMISVWRNGIQRNGVSFKLSNASHPGVKTLISGLFHSKKNVPQRLNIAKVLLLGVDDDGEAVWNNGNGCFLLKFKEFEVNFLKYGTWNEWNDIMAKRKTKGVHKYRDTLRNRHDHGNDKPSYWGLGYESIDEFRSSVSLGEFTEYCKNHLRCCGVRFLEHAFLLTLNDDR